MKDIRFTFYFAIIILILLPQNTHAQPEYKLDSLQLYYWDDPIAPMDWLMQQRLHYTYNNGGSNYTNFLQLLKDNNTSLWNNSSQSIRTFNVDDKLESDIFQNWDGAQWVNSTKLEYTYDGSGNNDVNTTYYYGIMDWVLSSQQLMTYNGSDLITESIAQQWAGSWTNVQKTTYTYSGDLLMEQAHYNWDVSDWAVTASSRNTYTYNMSDQLETNTQETYSGGWLNNLLITYTYNGDYIMDIVVQTWNGAWENLSQHIISYDVNNIQDEQITNSWSGSAWIASLKYVFYINQVGLNITQNDLLQGRAYPNPFTHNLNISLKSPLEHEGYLQLYDLQGKELSNTKLNEGVKTLTLNNPYLSKGIYFIKVASDSQNHTFKVIKQ